MELDVRLAADGAVVCAHDPTLARVTGGADRRRVVLVASRDLSRLVHGERIPLLAEVLELCRGRFVNVEVKADDAPSLRALARAVAGVLAADRGRAEVLVSSFDPRVVLAMAAYAPKVPRGMLVGDRTARLATALPLALRPILATANVQEDLLTPARIAQLRRAQLRVVAWTVNDAARAAALVSSGVSTIITDAPGRIVAALAR